MNVYIGTLYKEVEYIQSSGTQYIDTGIKGDISSYLSVDYKFTLVQNKSSGQQSIFGNIGSNGQGLAIYWDANSNQQGTWCGSGTGWYPGYITVGSVTTINATFNKTSGRTFSINGTTYTSSASNPNIDNGLNYFIFNDGRSSLAGYFKIYYFKIYKDGTLVRDFVPCYRVSDNVIGLFDKVNNKFYANAGTGTFTKGSDVGIFQPELKNAYIGDVWTPGSNTIAYYKFDGNLNDSSDNGYNLSLYAGSVTYGTESGGGKYAYFNTNTWTNNYTGFKNFNSDHFTAMWYWQPKQIFSSGYPIVMWLVTSGGTDIETTRRSIATGGGITLSAVNNTWYHLAQVRDGTDEKLYVNGVLYGTGTRTASGTTGTKFRLNNADNTNSSSYANDNYLGEMILEDRTWTAEEISHYYNLTKGNYGIN